MKPTTVQQRIAIARIRERIEANRIEAVRRMVLSRDAIQPPHESVIAAIQRIRQ